MVTIYWPEICVSCNGYQEGIFFPVTFTYLYLNYGPYYWSMIKCTWKILKYCLEFACASLQKIHYLGINITLLLVQQLTVLVTEHTYRSTCHNKFNRFAWSNNIIEVQVWWVQISMKPSDFFFVTLFCNKMNQFPYLPDIIGTNHHSEHSIL